MAAREDEPAATARKPRPGETRAQSERRERLARALRDNLGKRKEQDRARRSGEPDARPGSLPGAQRMDGGDS